MCALNLKDATLAAHFPPGRWLDQTLVPDQPRFWGSKQARGQNFIYLLDEEGSDS